MLTQNYRWGHKGAALEVIRSRRRVRRERRNRRLTRGCTELSNEHYITQNFVTVWIGYRFFSEGLRCRRRGIARRSPATVACLTLRPTSRVLPRPLQPPWHPNPRKASVRLVWNSHPCDISNHCSHNSYLNRQFTVNKCVGSPHSVLFWLYRPRPETGV